LIGQTQPELIATTLALVTIHNDIESAQSEILQEVVDGIFSGGDYLGFDSIDELNSGDHVRQQC
jgi:hypothetical protein